jgi:hypothetical protein
MPPDPFDRAARYLVRLYRELVPWLLTLTAEEAPFVQWLDTRRIPWPGSPERICDTVAHLRDPETLFPWAVTIEFSLVPDSDMPGRLLVYMGQVFLDLRPSEHPGDRFLVGGVVVNLTGKGNSGCDMHWPGAGLRTLLQVQERNLAGLSAERLLDQVEAGTAPRMALALLPLMQGGREAGIIKRCVDLASREPDPVRRADLGLALTFAEAAGCLGPWQQALKEWNVVESQVVKEWQRQARSEGKNEGKIEGKAEAILEVLQDRQITPPADLIAAIRACTDLARLRQLLGLAARAISIEQFRQDAGI